MINHGLMKILIMNSLDSFDYLTIKISVSNTILKASRLTILGIFYLTYFSSLPKNQFCGLNHSNADNTGNQKTGNIRKVQTSNFKSVACFGIITFKLFTINRNYTY